MNTPWSKAIENDEIIVFENGEEILASEINLDNEWVFKQLLNAGFFDEE